MSSTTSTPRLVTLASMEGSLAFLRSSVQTEGQKSAVNALAQAVDALRAEQGVLLVATGEPTAAQVEQARVDAGIELEDAFEAGSKWCVGDEELRGFAKALFSRAGAQAPEVAELLRKASILGKSIDGVLDEMSKAGQVSERVERISDYLDLMRRFLGEALAITSGSQPTPAPRTAPQPSAEVFNALAREGCGGDDVRWSFSDAGLRRTLAAYARWLAAVGTQPAAGTPAPSNGAARPVAMAMRDSDRGWWLAPVSQKSEDLLLLRGVKEGDLLYSMSAAYPLPDSLYPGSKDWMASNYAGRVEWLHVMYEAKKREIDALLDYSKRAPGARRYRMDLNLMGMVEDDEGGWVRLEEVTGASERDEWSNDAAQLLATFISLGAAPDHDKWAQAAAATTRLLNRPVTNTEMERLAAIAQEFRQALPSSDGQVLASMIEQGVTVLESYIRYAFAARGATPLTYEQKEAMHAVVSNAGRYSSGLLQAIWDAAHAAPGVRIDARLDEELVRITDRLAAVGLPGRAAALEQLRAMLNRIAGGQPR